MNDKQPIISENESINNIDTSTSINEISNGTFDEIVDSFQSVDKVQEIKKDITAEELKEQNPILEAPLNPTDPYAFHDPTMFFGMIIKSLNTDRGEYEASDAPVTSHKIDAIYFPLIRINQRLINNNDIIYTISNIIFPMVTFPYVSRILLVDGMGKVSFFSAMANYAIMIASLGISTYGIRATANVRNNKFELSKITAELLLINFVATVLVIFIIVGSIPLIPKFQDDKLLLTINCCLIFCSAFSLNWLYSGLEQYPYITKRSIAFKFISLVLVFLFVHTKSDYYKYAAITVFSTSGSYFLNLWYARHFVSLKQVNKVELKKHLKPMFLLFASILAVNVYTNLDTVMLGFMSGDREVGLYTMAAKVKWLLLSMVNAISAVLLPRLSYYLSENKLEDFRKVLNKSFSVILMISIPLTIFFIFEARDSIIILGGNDYVDATLCMQIIMPILLISGFSNITGNQILIPMGKDSCFMKAVIMGAITDLVLNIFLMPKFASVGAAIATLIAECVQMLIQLRYSFNDVYENFDIQNISKILISSGISCVVLVMLQGANFFTNFNAVFGAMLRIGVYSVVFFGTYWIVLLLLNEKNSRGITKEVLSKIIR